MTWQPDYISTADFLEYARVDDDLDDEQVAVWISAASRAIDRWAGRQFGKVGTPVERVYERQHMWCDSAGRFVVSIDDLMDTDGATFRGDSLTDVATLLPRNAVADGRPYTAARFSTNPLVNGEAPFVAPWGWNDYPVPVVNATNLQTLRFSVRRDSAYGITGSPESGTELRLLARVDPDVAVSLSGYQRRRMAA